MTSRNWRGVSPADMAQEQAAIDGLEFQTPEDRALFADAQLGAEVIGFWNSEAGRYLRERCGKTFHDKSKELADASPADVETIARLQVDIKAMVRLVEFVGEAIESGQNAEQEMLDKAEDIDPQEYN